MNIQNVFCFLDNLIPRGYEDNLWIPGIKSKDENKIEKKFMEVMDQFLSIDECTVKKAFIFYRWKSSPLNFYHVACFLDLRQVRDYIEEKKLISEQAMRRTFKDDSDITCAVFFNDLEFVRERLLLGANVNTSSTNSLLAIAASKGYVAMVKLLLSFNPDVNHTSPLIKLIESDKKKPQGGEDQYQIARLLIQHGANICLKDALNAEGIKLKSLLITVLQIKLELNKAIRLLLIGQKDSNSIFSLLPIEMIKKINDIARFKLVVEWAEERNAHPDE